MRMHFLNKLPVYMLVIQLVQDRGSQLHFGLSSLYLSCEIQLWVLVVFLHHSELHRVAFQDDWIASRMKNSAKMHLHLFTQTNENSRIFTQYRCHFRKSIFSVVEYCSACSRGFCRLGHTLQTSMSRRSHSPHSLFVWLVDKR